MLGAAACKVPLEASPQEDGVHPCSLCQQHLGSESSRSRPGLSQACLNAKAAESWAWPWAAEALDSLPLSRPSGSALTLLRRSNFHTEPDSPPPGSPEPGDREREQPSPGGGRGRRASGTDEGTKSGLWESFLLEEEGPLGRGFEGGTQGG